MANLRPMLLMGLIVLSYLLWVEWQKDYGQPANTPVSTQAASTSFDTSAIPDQGNDSLPAGPAAGDLPVQEPVGTGDQSRLSLDDSRQAVMTSGNELLIVTTDVLKVGIDLTGGTLVSAELLNYPEERVFPEIKVNLLSPGGVDMFIARMQYSLENNADEIRVPLTWKSEDGVSVTKTFVFKRGDYAINVRHTLTNNSGQAWAGSRYEQLQRAVPGDQDEGSFTNPGRYSFFGIGFYSPDEKLEKLDFDEVAGEPYKRSYPGGWLAMIQHYFFTAWIPPNEQVNSYSTQVYSPTGLPRYIARAVSPAVNVNNGESHEFQSRIYVGPKLQDTLNEIAPGLRHTVDYGIFTVFSKPLFWLMSGIHKVVQNWGWSIVLLTVLIKLLFFKLTEAQYRSMARMRKLQPRIEQLKERYGDDRQRMSQAMMEMYKTEKVNPLGGCLPILIQIPIFIALYWVLLESVELRQAPFILWIDNLSERDPYFILPLLNAVFMMLTQRLTPTAGMDPMQRKIMQFMPVGFSIMFAFFPAGLVLYWATNAGLSLAQQWYITRKIDAAA
jgi:YidC/Oxa1 family membrane protein insertase